MSFLFFNFWKKYNLYYNITNNSILFLNDFLFYCFISNFTIIYYVIYHSYTELKKFSEQEKSSIYNVVNILFTISNDCYFYEDLETDNYSFMFGKV